MKFKFNSKNAGSEGTTVASAIGGAALSKGAMSLVPEDKRTTLIKGGVAVAAVLALASIQGNGMTEKAIRGVLTGVAVQQGFETLADVVKPKLPVKSEDSTKSQKFIAAMFSGLNGAEGFDLSDNVWDDTDTSVIQMNTQNNPFTVNNVASV